MSHFTKIKTKLTSTEYIKKALDRMGVSYEEGNFTITQYGKSEKAEIKMDNAVGLSRQKDGTWAMVGDFYHSKSANLRKYYGYGNNNRFSSELSTSYAIEQTKSELEAQQFSCTDNAEAAVGKDGLIRMTYESYC